jgi:hypothetical protein
MIQTNPSYQNNGFIPFLIKILVKVIGKPPEQGAINVLYPALSPENKETGKFYNQGIEQKSNKLSDDQELAKKLWSISEEQILKIME